MTSLIGVVSGIIGIVMAFLLKAVQHLSYGHSPLKIISNETFLQIVYGASPTKRFMILSLAGVIAGYGWWALRYYSKPIVSVDDAVKMNKPIPILTTIINAFLQIVTIGMGSPLGRERAPREVGVLFAKWVANKTRLSASETKIMLACGAGAAFAAIYNVPLAGSLYVLEVLMCTMSWSALLPAFASSTIAVLTSWLGLGNVTIYHLADHNLNYPLLLWSTLSGPIYGFFAYWFIRAINHAKKRVYEDLSGFCILAPN